MRLVKGAYWDSEVKRAQERGLAGYPVFTRKPNTDVAYLACARALLAGADSVYPQFATHNAHTVASVIAHGACARAGRSSFSACTAWARSCTREIVGADKLDLPCRVYAPVGAHEDLLPYLVRRLLENGANTSFVNRIVDERLPADEIARDPIAQVEALHSDAASAHSRCHARSSARSASIPRASTWRTARSSQRWPRTVRRPLRALVTAKPIVDGSASRTVRETRITNPANRAETVGVVVAREHGSRGRGHRAPRARAQTDWNRSGASGAGHDPRARGRSVRIAARAI